MKVFADNCYVLKLVLEPYLTTSYESSSNLEHDMSVNAVQDFEFWYVLKSKFSN